MPTDFEKLTAAGTVPDNVQAGAHTAFIFESPYKDEIALGQMLSGSAGKAFVRHFAKPATGTAVALGQLLAAKKKLPAGLIKVSTLNACSFPMDARIYLKGGPRAGVVNQAIIQGLEQARKGKTAGLSAAQLAVYNDIVDDLKERLLQLDVKTRIVPCGDGARQMVEDAIAKMTPSEKKCIRAQVRTTNALGNKIYHPSFGGWTRKSGQHAPIF